MKTIRNKQLTVKVKNPGAALTSIVSNKNNKEYLWRGDATFWSGQAPILFPFVGRLKDDTFIANDAKFHQGQHGFFRRSEAVAISQENDAKLICSVESDTETLKVYPYDFSFETTYELIENRINITHTVVNKGANTMYFSIGEHPAFNCSLENPDESYENCSIVFETEETSKRHHINAQGLRNHQYSDTLQNTKELPLHKNSFDQDAFVFTDLKSEKITLKNNTEGNLVTVHYKGFKHMGIWSKPNAPYVCIEPWLGYADAEDSSQKIEEKEAITALEAGKTFEISFEIEIHD